MKNRKNIPRAYYVLALTAILLSIGPLAQRWREERQDRRVAMAVEWNEYSDFNARRAVPISGLLHELRAQGVSALVISPLTLSDALSQHRVKPRGPSINGDLLDVNRIALTDPALARQMLAQWSWRGVSDLRLRIQGKTAEIDRAQGTFTALKDTDVGYDPNLLALARASGLTPILRITADPWLQSDSWITWLQSLPLGQTPIGVLFGSDDLPGGLTNISFWKTRLRDAGVTQFLPEFHPAAAAWQMANILPANTYRAHSIPATELKDLKPEQQLARWHRAVEERSCRLLLVRLGPSDSRESFLNTLASLQDLLQRHRWTLGFPAPRNNWPDVSRTQRYLLPILAFGMVVIAPLIALRWGLMHPANWKTSFFKIILGSVLGSLIAAAVAQNPITRLEIVPFRGVKLGFILSWGLTLLVLFSWKELQTKLSQHLRRWDVLIGGLAATMIGYIILRSGNASADWKPSWEQHLRDILETLLIARPRFKEFAIGLPLLWAGLYFRRPAEKPAALDPRWLLWIGMLGPISIVNTFCHLHSPLALELLRTFNGVVLGVLFGLIVVRLLRSFWLLLSIKTPSVSRHDDALVYFRS